MDVPPLRKKGGPVVTGLNRTPYGEGQGTSVCEKLVFAGCPGTRSRSTEQCMVRHLLDRTQVPPLCSSSTFPKFLCDSHMLSNGTGVMHTG